MKKVTSSSAPSPKAPSHVLGSGPSPSASASSSSRPSNPNPRLPTKQQAPCPAGPSDFTPFTPLVSSYRRPDANDGDTVASPNCGDAFSSEHLDGCLAGAGGARSRAAAYLACSPPGAAVEVVKKLLGNLLKDPGNDKYRRVSLGNPRIKEAVADRERGLELLESVGFTIGDESGELFAVMDETPNAVKLGGIRQAVLLLERSQPSEEAASKESCPSGVEQKEVMKIVDRQDVDMEVAMSQTQDINLLDPKNAPLLLFLQYNEPDEDELDGSGSQESYGTDKRDYENDDDQDIGEPNDAFLIYSISRNFLQSRTIDDLEGHYYWITPQGWFLILHRDSHATYIWNPFTRERISLPVDEEDFLTKNTTRCLLSHKPSDPKCIVLVVSCRDTVLWYCHPGGNRWFKHTYESSMLAERRGAVIGGMQILTAVGGEFYTYFSGHLVVLKFTPDSTFTRVPVADKENHMYGCVDRVFLESCGELFRLDFCRLGFTPRVQHVSVHRLDMAEKAWLEVESLGDRVFFVNSTYFGASLSAQKLGLKGNCIYYLRLDDKALYVHDMERGTVVMHDPGQDILDHMTPQFVMPAC